MRIAYISQSYPPMISGAAITVARLAQGMSSRQHTVLVLAASDTGQARVEQADNLRTVRLASYHNPKRAYQRFAPLSIRAIATELRRFAPDILHIHDVLTVGITGMFVARSLHTPVIATLHALPWFITSYLPDIPGLRPVIENTLWAGCRWLSARSAAVVVPTPTIAKTLQARAGFQALAISNGVDLDRFAAEPAHPGEKRELCARYHLDPERPIVLHVGRLDVDKHVERVIRAGAQAMRDTNAQLLIVGDGECKADCQDLASQLGVADSCGFPGFVAPDGDLSGLYRMADVFTTACEIETQGLVLLEALASGVPVVAVRATCIPELVQEGVTGHMVPPGDVDALADRLVRLIEHPAQAKAMGRNGRQFVERHALEHSLDQHEALYRTHVLSRQGTRDGRPHA